MGAADVIADFAAVDVGAGDDTGLAGSAIGIGFRRDAELAKVGI